MPHRRVADVLKQGQPGDAVEVRGWVRTRRDSKAGFSFVEINDGSCLANLQVLLPAETAGYADLAKRTTTGASVVAAGELVESPGKGQRVELHADAFRVIGLADPEAYPLQKKRHSFEFLREIAHLRTRTNSFGAVFRVRNRVCAAIHEFFQERGFLYVQTPIITASDCEGAGAMFRVSAEGGGERMENGGERMERGAAAANPAGASDPPSSILNPQSSAHAEFFGKPAFLTVSGQLEAEIFACSLGPCYTFGPTFRAENSNTTRHLAEFWMIEPEMPFYDLNDNMALAEAFVRHLCRTVLEDCAVDMAFFAERIDKSAITTLEAIAGQEFLRVSYSEAVAILKASGQKFAYPVEWRRDLQSEHERFLTETHFQRPVILYDYPRAIKPFYMRCNDADAYPEGPTVRAMDVLVPRVGEIVGGSQREERADVLEARMLETGLDPAAYWWYLELRKYGTVPHAGFGLGLERLMLLITGMQNIRDVIPFPRTPKSAEF